MKIKQFEISYKVIACVFGASMVTMVIHWTEQPGLYYGSIAQASLLVLMGCMMFFVKKYDGSWRDLLGSKWLYIPLGIISLSIIIRPLIAWITGVSQLGMQYELSSSLYGIALFGIYMVARGLKDDVFIPFLWASVITAISCITYGVIYWGYPSAGVIQPTYTNELGNVVSGNYDIAAGVIIFGFLAGISKHRWWLSGVAILGLSFTMAYEAVFALAIIGLVCYIREVRSYKTLTRMALPYVVILAVMIGMVALNQYAYAKPLYERIDYLNGETSAQVNENNISPIVDAEIDWLTFYRARGYQHAIDNFQFFGNGFNYGHFYRDIPHNVPLIIVHQIGVIGALAWLFIVGYGIIKTRYKYAWLAIAALSVFDHFIWTQAGVWFWALAGVSSASRIKADYIFREV